MSLQVLRSAPPFDAKGDRVKARLRFGVFMAPLHNPVQNPTLQLREDLARVCELERLGFDEVWFGEHHSGGTEIWGSPEIMIASAAEMTERIKLGTGVISIPYHNPFMVAERMNLLDHLTRGRAMMGVGGGNSVRRVDDWRRRSRAAPHAARRVRCGHGQFSVTKALSRSKRTGSPFGMHVCN